MWFEAIKSIDGSFRRCEFFYNEDKKASIDQYVEKLKLLLSMKKSVVSMRKMQRVQVIVRIIGEQVGLSEGRIDGSATSC